MTFKFKLPGGQRPGTRTMSIPGGPLEDPDLPVGDGLGGAGRAHVEGEWLGRIFFGGKARQVCSLIVRGARTGIRGALDTWPGAPSAIVNDI